MTFLLTLTIDGVNFTLIPSEKPSSGDSSIVTVKQKFDTKTEENKVGDEGDGREEEKEGKDDDKELKSEVAEVIADLNNFCGTLRVSRTSLPSSVSISHSSDSSLSSTSSDEEVAAAAKAIDGTGSWKGDESEFEPSTKPTPEVDEKEFEINDCPNSLPPEQISEKENQGKNSEEALVPKPLSSRSCLEHLESSSCPDISLGLKVVDSLVLKKNKSAETPASTKLIAPPTPIIRNGGEMGGKYPFGSTAEPTENSLKRNSSVVRFDSKTIPPPPSLPGPPPSMVGSDRIVSDATNYSVDLNILEASAFAFAPSTYVGGHKSSPLGVIENSNSNEGLEVGVVSRSTSNDTEQHRRKALLPVYSSGLSNLTGLLKGGKEYPEKEYPEKERYPHHNEVQLNGILPMSSDGSDRFLNERISGGPKKKAVRVTPASEEKSDPGKTSLPRKKKRMSWKKVLRNMNRGAPMPVGYNTRRKDGHGTALSVQLDTLNSPLSSRSTDGRRRGAEIGNRLSEDVTVQNNKNGGLGDEDEGERDNDPFVLSSDRLSNTTTRLHVACLRHRTKIGQLRSILKESPQMASTRDVFGRFPLHVFAQNKTLAHLSDYEEAEQFVREMLDINPSAMRMEDLEGNIPFISNVSNWIDDVLISRVAPYESQSLTFSNAGATSLTEVEEMHLRECSSVVRRLLFLFPSGVHMPSFVKWSFDMLSATIDHLNPRLQRRESGRPFLEVHRDQLIERFASIPYLFKTVLLVDNDDEVSGTFNKPIFRAAMLSKSAVDYWIVPMLRYHRGGINISSAGPGDDQQIKPSSIVRARAVEFLHCVSDVTVADLVGYRGRVRQHDQDKFEQKKNQVLETIASLEGLIPSMLVLKSKQIEDAATTQVLRYAVDNWIRDPLVIGRMLLEMYLHLILMIAYRMNIAYHTSNHMSPELSVNSYVSLWDTEKSPALLAVVTAGYFLLRDCVTISAIMASQRRLVKSFFADFWSLVDLASVLAVLATTVWVDISGISPETSLFAALTTGSLWMKLLGFLKTLNMPLATFILAIIEIGKEMRWFLLVMLISIVMFSDMLMVVAKSSDVCVSTNLSRWDRGLDARDDLCSDNPVDGFIRLFSIIVGDVSLDDYTQSNTTTAFFIMFTFFGVIILLNVLIAIVEDAYQKAKIRGLGLFGRARVEFVARQQARLNFLRPVKSFSDENRYFSKLLLLWRNITRCFLIMSTSLIIVLVEILLFDILSCAREDFGSSNTFVKFLIASLLLVAICFNASLFSLVPSITAQWLPGSCGVGFFNNSIFFRLAYLLVTCPIATLSRLMGIDRDARDHVLVDEQWLSRQQYLEKSMKELVKKESEQVVSEIKNELKATEQRLKTGKGPKKVRWISR